MITPTELTAPIDDICLFYRAWLPPNARRAVVMVHRGHEHSGRLVDVVDELALADGIAVEEMVICIDDSARTLVVSPDPVVIHDVRRPTAPRRSRSNGSPPPGWATSTSKSSRAASTRRAATATANAGGDGAGARKACKYDVWVTDGKHDRLDPTVVVEGCCP